jgi:ribosomal protein L34
MRYRLKTSEGRAIYARRKSTVEPVIGNIKRSMGFRQFSLRGIEKVAGEWTLACASWNMRRMHSLKWAL